MMRKNNSNTSANSAPSAVSQVSNSPTATPQLFSNSPYAQSSYLISTPTYDAATTQALTGFMVQKTALPDGSTQIVLNAQNPNYQTQTYVVKPGEKLYFIEGMPGDDSGGVERNTGDDTAVLVDANGYIVTQ